MHEDAGADEIMSEVQADDYYAIMPEWVLFHPDLSHGAVRLYGVLRRFADQRGIAFPGLSAIGQKYVVTPRSVTRHMDELIAAGAVTKKRRIGRAGRATSNLYRVHSRPTFLNIQDDYSPSTAAATAAAAKARATLPDDQRTKMSDGDVTKMSDGPSDKNVRLTTATTNHSQDEPQGSAALRAATAETVETSSSVNQFRNASASDDDAAANEISPEHSDAPRAETPAQILDAMMLNPDEQTRFRAWLISDTGARNPSGLIVTLHGSGRLSERLSQWRASENTADSPTPAQEAATQRPGRLEWCGRCDENTRMLTAADEDGEEYIRRCPACHIMAGVRPPGAGAHQVIAMQAEAAARATGTGRAAFHEARATLPAGTPRRTTTIGKIIDPTTTRDTAESEH